MVGEDIEEAAMSDGAPHRAVGASERQLHENQELAARWPELNDDDWEHLPIIPVGDHLEPGKTYFDLNHPERGTFKALGRQEVTGDNCFVAHDDLDPALWETLTGGG
jgi:hypothetical protein